MNTLFIFKSPTSQLFELIRKDVLSLAAEMFPADLKEIEKVLSLLPRDATYYFTQAHIPRAIDAAGLQEKAIQSGLRGHSYPDVNVAINDAKNHAGESDLIIICGSVFLVGEVI